MRFTLIIIILFCTSTSKASNYYFSSVSGDDSRSVLQARNPNTPWKTINKLNSFFPTLFPGDSVLFKKGETFGGTIIVTTAGTTGLPIVLSSYGTGSKPIINGFATLQNWVSLGNGIWESNCSECATKVNILQINGVQQPMGRFPNLSAANKGYLTIKSTNGTSQITDNQLPSSPNWTGGEVVIRKARWIIDRNVITSHSGNTINYTSASSYPSQVNYGYFIQNHPSTLDQNGEWYYDVNQKKIRIYYASGNPNSLSIKASAVNLLAYSEMSNITFDNLAFHGANVEAFEIFDASNFKIKNCDILFIGSDAIYAENTSQFTLENCSLQDVGNNAVYLANNCSNSIIRSNKIKRTGVYAGTGYSGNNSYQAITVYGENNLIEYNQVDSTGYNAITFHGSNNNIKNNSINYFTITKDDGGGIYTWTGEQNTTIYLNRKVTGNIVLNGIGAIEGSNNMQYIPSEGIYMDDNTKNVDISDNTVAYCSQAGMLLHNSSNLKVRNNTLFNNNRQWYLIHDSISPNSPLRNLELKGNILFSRNPSYLNSDIRTIKNDISQMGVFDSNYYCRPQNQNAIIFTSYFNNTTVNESHTLETWKSKFGKDPASQISPAAATDSILFEYNTTAAVKTLVLNGKFVDVKNNQFSGTVNLSPYSSIILIKKASNCNTSNWVGTVDASWHNPLNWSCAIVPDENTNVTIGTGTPFNCIINFPATCRSLTIATGAQLRANKNLVITH